MGRPKKYINETLEEKRIREKEYYRLYHIKHRELHKEKYKINRKERYIKEKEKYLERQKKWRDAHKEQEKNRRAKYKKEHKEQIRTANKKYYLENTALLKEKTRVYKNLQYKTNPNYYLTVILRNRLRHALNRKKVKKSISALKLVGCDIVKLREHLESQFKEGMNWNNNGLGKGKWVIDHILPCSYFNMLDIEEQKKCFHYTNLQPLWFEDNLYKSDKIIIK